MSSVASRRPAGLFRMIAIDLDGTLLTPAGTVSPRTRSAIHQCLQAGLLVCFATGRNWTESRVVLEAVGHYPTAVFAGGAMVLDTANEAVLHRQLMAPALAREVCAFLEDAGFFALVLQDTGAAGVDYLASAHVPLDASTEFWVALFGSSLHRVTGLRHHAHEHTMRIGTVGSPERTSALWATMQAQFGERIVGHTIHVPAHGSDVLEVFDPAVNKWEAVKLVAARHNVKLNEIICIGDDVNDVPMLRNAGLGVAMGNAKPAAIAAAKRVIGSNREDGLAIFLEALVASHTMSPAPA